MIGITNCGFGGGGGGGNATAVIRVLYKSGTTSTCVSGQTSLSSDDSGDFMFFVPSAGNWVITGSDSSGASKTATVFVAANDMKTVLFDSLIPPENREYYREVEYLRIIGNTRASIPLIVNTADADWYIKIDKFIPEYTTADNSSCGIIGNRRGGTSAIGFQADGIKDNSLYIFGVNDTVSNSPKTYISSGVPYNIKLLLKSRSELYVNNEETPILTHSDATRRGNTFFVGCNGVSHGHPVGVACPGYYYSVEIARENTVVSKYVPSVRIKNPDTGESDIMPGYYDVLNNAFYQGVYCAYDKTTPSYATADVITQITAGPYLYQ